MTLVLDASPAAAWCFEDENTPTLETLIARVAREGAVAPSIWPLEVSNALHMAVRRRRITDAKCRAACVAIAGLDVLIDRETTRRAWTDIMDIAVHYDLTTYDASYLELALRLSLPLAALDGRLREAAQKASVPLLGK